MVTVQKLVYGSHNTYKLVLLFRDVCVTELDVFGDLLTLRLT